LVGTGVAVCLPGVCELAACPPLVLSLPAHVGGWRNKGKTDLTILRDDGENRKTGLVYSHKYKHILEMEESGSMSAHHLRMRVMAGQGVN
jgi:hypothetical protein